MRRYSEADSYFDRSIALDPHQKNSYRMKSQNYLVWKGSIREARDLLEKAGGKKDEWDILQWVGLDFCDRKFDAALNRLSSASFELIQGAGVMITKSQLEGLAYQYMGKTKESESSFQAARVILEKEAEQQPNNASTHSALGIVYAGLSKKEQAVTEAKLAVSLGPVSDDIFSVDYVGNLAQVYAMVGEQELAIEQLEYLLSIPNFIVSKPLLRIDPRWDQLRDHPRFQKLLRD
jgi:tetratricopeptide (TPR) repeat protein